MTLLLLFAGQPEPVYGVKLTPVYNIRNAVPASLAPTWDIRVSTYTTLALVWDIHGLASSALVPSWDVRNVAPLALAPSWDVRNTVESQLTPIWGIHKPVTAHVLAPSWDIRQVAGCEFTPVWDIRGLCAAVLNPTYAILGPLRISLVPSWDIHGAPSWVLLCLQRNGAVLTLARLDTGEAVTLAAGNPEGTPRLAIGRYAGHTPESPVDMLRIAGHLIYGSALDAADVWRNAEAYRASLLHRDISISVATAAD